MNPLRTLLAVVAAEAAALSAALASIYASSFVGTGDSFSAEDLVGFASIAALATLALCLLVYVPALLLLLRRRPHFAPRPLPLLGLSALLNLPAAVALLLGLRAGSFSGAGEVVIFFLAFLAAGWAFTYVVLRGRRSV